MLNKININFKEIAKHDITLDEFLYLLAVYYGYPIKYDTFDSLCSKGFLSYDSVDKRYCPVNPNATSRGIEKIETILLNSEFGEDDSNNRFILLASKLIELFPKGRKEGTNYMWRDSKALIAKRLKTIIKKYDVEFTDEEAIDATKRYIASFNGDYTYMQLLKYFIFKKNTATGEENSQFLSYLENDDSSNPNDTNWMDSVR